MEHHGSQHERTVEMIVFQINKKEYGISVYAVKEVIKIPNIVPIPNAPEFIAGVINLRGNIICVIDLRRQFNFSSVNNENTRIMIVRIKSMIVGLMVDTVTEVIKVVKHQIDPVPEILNLQLPYNCLVGIAKVDDRIITLLNLENIFSEKQLNQLTRNP